jgi:replicative DNA helicase
MLDVQMPSNKDAEEAFLGSLLIDPNLIRKSDVKTSDFYIIRNRWIYESMKVLYSKDHTFDLLTLSNELEKDNRLIEIGGQQYILELIGKTPSSINYGNYAEIIKEKSQRRKMLTIANEIAQKAYSDEPINEIIGNISTELVGISRPEGGAIKISEYVSEFYDDVIERTSNPKEIYGIPTGIKDWDNITKGNQRGEVTLIAARPNVGKTILLTQMAVGMSRNAPGAFYEMEMGGISIVRRTASWLGKIPTYNMRSGHMNKYIDKFTDIVPKLEKLNMYVSDSTSWDTVSLKADLARLKDEYKIEWFCLDYMLLLKDTYGKNRNDRIDRISSNLHDICKDLDIAGIIVHTLNKEGFGEEADLQHTGGTAGVNYDADNVVFMTKEKDSKVVELKWKKIREGEGDAYMKMVKLDGYPALGEYSNPTMFPKK